MGNARIRAAALNLVLVRVTYHGLQNTTAVINYAASNSALAQLVEQLTVNQRVAGSSPAGGARQINQLGSLDPSPSYA